MRRVIDICFVSLIVLCLAAGGLFTLWGERAAPVTALFYDNRTPAPKPGWSKEGLWTGADFSALDSYLSDRFPHRDDLIGLDTSLDMAMGRPVIHKVAMGEGAIFPFHGYSTWDTGYLTPQSEEAAARLAALQQQARYFGGELYYLGVPHQYSYFAEKYPRYMDDRQWLLAPLHTAFPDALEAAGVPFVDMTARFDQLGRPEALYSASDHHYTYLGALETYQTVLERARADTGLDIPILTQDDLILEELPNPFLGSQNRQVYGKWKTAEKLTVARLKEPIPFRRYDNGVEVEASLYALPKTDDEVVTYGLYMGGDVAETAIQTDRPWLPRCLIWGDSFTNPLETVLWASFDETRSLDLRHYTEKSLADYIADFQPHVIICLRDDTAWLDATGNGDLS